jgi:hypothetical protein
MLTRKLFKFGQLNPGMDSPRTNGNEVIPNKSLIT